LHEANGEASAATRVIDPRAEKSGDSQSYLRRTQIPPTDSGYSVGNAIAHDSAARQIQGTAQYIDDIPEAAELWHIAPGYAMDAAKGGIAELDLEAVRAAPGVVAVLTAADIPGRNECSPSIGGDPIFADGRVEFHGQVIFAVVAQTREQARRAARLVKIEIDPEEIAVTVEDGLATGETVLPDYRFLRGDPGRAMNGGAHSASGSIRVGGQEHFYLEGQVAMAVPGEGGEIHVYSSTQHPSEVQQLVADMLARSKSEVVCECRRMGGGFGGKESQASQWGCIAALAASVTGSAAKLRLDRDDDMIMTGKRHDVKMDYSYAHDDKGRLSAVDVEFNARCGFSADLSLGVCDRTMFHADNAYYYPNVRILSRRVKTDTVSNTAFRGFGGPQGMVFAERMMDEIAIRLGIDPLDVRKRNLYGRDRDITPYGMKVTDNIAPRLIRELEKTSDYRQRRKAVKAFNRKNRFLKKGIALTPVKFGIAFTLKHLNQAGALVHVYTDGSVQVNHGGTEMGQGLYTKVAQVVAEEFGIDFDKVKITATQTDKVPNTTPTAASSGSDLNGMAAKRAAGAIKDRMAELAGRLYQANKSEIRFARNMVQLGEREISFAELASTCFLERVSLSSTGYFATPKITWNRETASGQPFLYFSYGGACSEVTIDTLTGEMRVERVDALLDVGKSLNPAIDIGQIEGGFVQGMGWQTTEELVFDESGRLTTHAPSTYKIPTASDVPEDFRVVLWDSKGNKEPTIYRSKAVGEPPVMLSISVFSAITDAVASLRPGRVPQLDAPATPETIARAVRFMLDE
jgi:xanthine dehydrogenase large subunit